MAINPDPRPGRWLLPLVVLGMVVFTYVFVRSLPGAEANADGLGDNLGSPVTGATTQPAGNGGTDETTTTTTPPPALDPETQAYLDQLSEFESQLTALQTEMSTINGQWDAEPRQIEFGEAEAALVDLASRVEAWAGEVVALTPPEQLASLHETVGRFATAAAEAADAVVAGLRAPDTGEQRRAAIDQFDQAVRGFTAAVDDVEQAARDQTGA